MSLVHDSYRVYICMFVVYRPTAYVYGAHKTLLVRTFFTLRDWLIAKDQVTQLATSVAHLAEC